MPAATRDTDLEPPPTRDPTRFAPVFVLSTARSYSSVVNAMIGQHPELLGLPELKLFAYPTLGELEASLPDHVRRRGYAHRSPGLVRAVAELEFAGQDPPALTAALEWLRRRPAWTGADALDLLMDRARPRVVVEKSPDHVLGPDALPRLAAAYPRARYVHLTRHPVATIVSMDEHLRRTLPGYRGGRFAPDCVEHWLAAHGFIVTLTQRLPAARWVRIRAEDVLNDSAAQLAGVARWLGLDAGAPAIAAMLHPERSPFAGFAPAASGVRGGNDPAFLGDPRPRRVLVPRSLAAPRGWSVPPSLWARVTRAARELGYG